MSRFLSILALIIVSMVTLHDPCQANAPQDLRGTLWIQPAYGFSAGDDLVRGRVGADVSISDIPLIGLISTTVPVRADVTFNNPTGILVGGELALNRFGVELNLIYLPDAATVQAGVQVCGGLLTASQCNLIELGSFLVPGLDIPDAVVVQKKLGNAAITLGFNYHVFTSEKWDLWVGPMGVWSMWDEYDFSDVRVNVSMDVESLLQGNVGGFELSNYADLAPKTTLTFGANVGGSYELGPRWNLLGQFRYFDGDDLILPGGSGRYRVAGFSLGLSYRFRG